MTDPLTNAGLDELERLEKKARSGPWMYEECYTDQGVTEDVIRSQEWGSVLNGDIARSDRDLIIALRNAAPKLIAEIRELRKFKHALDEEARRKAGC